MWIGVTAAELLGSSRSMTVHSVFASSFNLIATGTPSVGKPVRAERLLSVSFGSRLAGCPFGIEIDNPVRAELGQHWRCDGTTLTAGSATIQLTGLQPDPCRIEPQRATPDALSALPDSAAAFANSGLAGLARPSEILTRLERVASGLRAGSDMANDALWLMGRGPGLTPSGDDMLVGMLAAHRACAGGPIHPLLTAATSHVDAAAESWTARTTDVGAAYLIQAMRGRFSRPLIALAQALRGTAAETRAACTRLRDFGQSSGADTLLGFTVYTHCLPGL
ncbi:DUF2877 domain-containing protein [Paraburkholderia silviterrae]|uniref:DUF2877 domain-containing protein n=1 Tax=Paraburkholderia silviterrae TaxID=2528715 RepID=A0A4V2ZZ50_9BURK|nr:DUF2877 domain-containing protein [Paraburkholderia silviterrae]TDG23664.1 DUF2877 domain-containing protein [Paraburkholderia silviterrae]